MVSEIPATTDEFPATYFFDFSCFLLEFGSLQSFKVVSLACKALHVDLEWVLGKFDWAVHVFVCICLYVL